MALYDEQGTELSNYCHVLNSSSNHGDGSIPRVPEEMQTKECCSSARFLSESPAMAGLLRFKTGRVNDMFLNHKVSDNCYVLMN